MKDSVSPTGVPSHHQAFRPGGWCCLVSGGYSLFLHLLEPIGVSTTERSRAVYGR